MRILAVVENPPWPPTGGSLLRLAAWVETLAGLGEVDLFVLTGPDRDLHPVPVPLHRVAVSPYPAPSGSLRWRARWAAGGGLPLEVALRAGDTGPRHMFEAWVAPRYDVTYVSTAAAFHWLGHPSRGPTVVDLDNLEDRKTAGRIDLLRPPPAAGPAARARAAAARLQARVNANDWGRLQQAVADRVDRVTLASPVDVVRSGLPNAELVPNAYPPPDHPAGRFEVGDPPVVLLPGSLTYPPNMDAARWLVEEVAPRLAELVPGVAVRLAGEPGTGVAGLHDPPAVTVVGRVASMAPELARAGVTVVPVRYGGGTRVKILESFAHRVPVVSTTLGAEGLDVEDGSHLLVADTPAGLAEACAAVLTDPALRARLVAAAEARYRQAYDGEDARDRIRRLVRALAPASTRR